MIFNSLRKLVTLPIVLSISCNSAWGVGTYKDLIQKYEKVEVLGSGAQGEVTKYKCKNSEEYVAIKKISRSNKACKSEQLACESKEILSGCPYFCKPIEYFQDEDDCYFVYEYLIDSPIEDIVNLIQQKKDLDVFLCKIALQFMIAWKHLYDNGLSYGGDQNARNYFLTIDRNSNTLILKLIDYGFFHEGKSDVIKCYRAFGDLISYIERFTLEYKFHHYKIKKRTYRKITFDTPKIYGFFLKLGNTAYFGNFMSKRAERRAQMKDCEQYFKTYDEAIEYLNKLINEGDAKNYVEDSEVRYGESMEYFGKILGE